MKVQWLLSKKSNRVYKQGKIQRKDTIPTRTTSVEKFFTLLDQTPP